MANYSTVSLESQAQIRREPAVFTTNCKPKISAVSCANIKSRDVDWLWQDVIVKGGLSTIQGLAGIGKSWLLCALSAAVSSGGGVQGTSGESERVTPGRVLYLSGDDEPDTCLKPRLETLCANSDNIFFAPDGLTPTIGSPEMEQLFAEVQPSLVILDTLQHFLPGNINPNNMNSTTVAVQPLKALAVKYNAAVVAIQHISKIAASGNGGASVNFGIGSSAINGLFRSVWTLGRLKDDEGKPSETRALCPSKTNLVKGNAPAVLFELSAEKGFVWAGVDEELQAEDLYNPLKSGKRGRPKDALVEAEEFLLVFLREGERTSTEIEQAAKEYNISAGTLRRAKRDICASYQQGREWYSRLK